MNFLTVSEAVDFTGKSRSTIKRLIAGIGTDHEPDHVRMFPGEKIQKENYRGSLTRNLINKQYLIAYFALEQSNRSESSRTENSNEQYIRQLESDKEYLKDQLSNRDNQINSFLELEQQYVEQYKRLQMMFQQERLKNNELQQLLVDRVEPVNEIPYNPVNMGSEPVREPIQEPSNEPLVEEEDLKDSQQKLSEERRAILEKRQKPTHERKSFSDWLY